MSIIDTGKDIAKLAQQLGNIEIQQKVIELQSEILQMQEEVQNLRKENKELNDHKAIDDALVLTENAYYNPNGAETRKGPFCKVCYDAEKLLINLDVNTSGYQTCPKCQNGFHTAKSQEAHAQATARSNAAQQTKARGLRIGRG